MFHTESKLVSLLRDCFVYKGGKGVHCFTWLVVKFQIWSQMVGFLLNISLVLHVYIAMSPAHVIGANLSQ